MKYRIIHTLFFCQHYFISKKLLNLKVVLAQKKYLAGLMSTFHYLSLNNIPLQIKCLKVNKSYKKKSLQIISHCAILVLLFLRYVLHHLHQHNEDPVA